MANGGETEQFVFERISYPLQLEDRLILIENVPARVSKKTGEHFFSPETVERLQQIAWEQQTPIRVMQTPVFSYPMATG